MTDILETTVRELFDSNMARGAHPDGNGWDAGLWTQLEDLGITSIGTPEVGTEGGGSLVEAAVVVRVAAEFATSIPIGETLIAATLLGIRDVRPSGAWSVAVSENDQPRIEATVGGYKINGAIRRVPWVRSGMNLAISADLEGEGTLVSTSADRADLVNDAENLAGERHVDVVFNGAPLSSDEIVGPMDSVLVSGVGAVTRAIQIAGALEGVLKMSVRYASEREQFGRPIARFQAVQQMIAELAEEASIARAASEAAVAEVANGLSHDALMPIAAAKTRAGMAATVGARLAHQVHGAIGFTQEHSLHRLTRRLWSWRDEYGSDSYWASIIGKRVGSAGSGQLWASLTK